MKNNKIKICLHWVTDSIYKDNYNKQQAKDFLEVWNNPRDIKRKDVRNQINRNLKKLKRELKEDFGVTSMEAVLIPCFLYKDDLKLELIM